MWKLQEFIDDNAIDQTPLYFGGELIWLSKFDRNSLRRSAQQ
jgi:hypothetical protein